jgi:hypothetical protein
MQLGNTLEDSRSNTGQRRPRAGPKWAQAGRPSPLRDLVGPFDLATIQAIYSPKARSHTSTHSPSATEEKRREGHHLREERVELFD